VTHRSAVCAAASAATTDTRTAQPVRSAAVQVRVQPAALTGPAARPAAGSVGGVRSLRLAPWVLAAAGRVYLRGLALIVPVAVIVFGASDLATRVVGEWLDQSVATADVGRIAFVVALLLAALTASMFAEVLFAGMLDRVVESDMERRPAPSFGAVVRDLPYRRLLLADGLVVGLGILGLALLVVPGLAAFTLLALAGPLVIIEGLGPWRAVRRSFELLRGRLGAAIVLVLVPGLIVSSVDDWLEVADEHWPTIARVGADVVVDATLAAFAGLLLAVLARRLTTARS